MPFYDDAGIDTSIDRGPLWQSFAVFGGQLERMIALNIAWAVQLFPAMIALAVPELPGIIRVVLLAYSVAAFAPATVVLYSMAKLASDDETLMPIMVKDILQEKAVIGSKTLIPLVGLLALLVFISDFAGQANIFALAVVAQLGLFLLLVSANFWGPLIAQESAANAQSVLRQSGLLIWRYPFQTMLLCGAVALSLFIGVISIGGLFLAVPVIITLLQTQMYQAIILKQRRKAKKAEQVKQAKQVER